MGRRCTMRLFAVSGSSMLRIRMLSFAEDPHREVGNADGPVQVTVRVPLVPLESTDKLSQNYDDGWRGSGGSRSAHLLGSVQGLSAYLVVTPVVTVLPVV